MSSNYVCGESCVTALQLPRPVHGRRAVVASPISRTSAEGEHSDFTGKCITPIFTDCCCFRCSDILAMHLCALRRNSQVFLVTDSSVHGKESPLLLWCPLELTMRQSLTVPITVLALHHLLTQKGPYASDFDTLPRL